MPRTRDGTLFTRDPATGQFIASLGLETGAAAVPKPADATTCADHVFDCAVVGSGWAALIALRELVWRAPYSKIVVIEARDRTGGRTWTADLPWGGADGSKVKVEIGGTWVHASQPHVFAELSRYGLRNAVIGSESLLKPGLESLAWVNEDSGKLERVETDPTLFDTALTAFFDMDGSSGQKDIPLAFNLSTAELNAEGLAKWDKLSVLDRINQLLDEGKITQRHAQALEAYMGSLALQPDPAKIGFVECWRWFALPGHTVHGLVEAGGVWKLKHGMSHILGLVIKDILDSGAEVSWIFDRVVDKVEEKNGVVSLSTQLNPLATPSATNPDSPLTFAAKTTIVTVPHNVLHKISFSPELSPAKVAAIKDVHQGIGYKFIAHAAPDSGIPPDASGFAVGPAGKPPGFHMTMGDKRTGSGGALLVGFGADPALCNTFPSVYTPDAKHDSKAVLDALFASFPSLDNFGSPKVPVDAYAIHAHTQDPFSLGTWSMHGPGFWSSGHDKALREKHGRVYFASSDYSEGWKGFVDGGIEMGLAVGKEVADFLKENKTV